MRWSASQTLSQIICRKPLRLEDRQWTSDMGPKLQEAQKRLAASLSEDDVRAFGRKSRHAALEGVPGNIFRIKRVELVVSPHGELQNLSPHRELYEGEEWQSIEFDATEIRKTFPSPPRQSVEQWMQQEANRYEAEGKIGKRTAMVDACRQTTGCTRREAEDAHARLPQHLRRKKGKPSKSLG